MRFTLPRKFLLPILLSLVLLGGTLVYWHLSMNAQSREQLQTTQTISLLGGNTLRALVDARLNLLSPDLLAGTDLQNLPFHQIFPDMAYAAWTDPWGDPVWAKTLDPGIGEAIDALREKHSIYSGGRAKGFAAFIILDTPAASDQFVFISRPELVNDSLTGFREAAFTISSLVGGAFSDAPLDRYTFRIRDNVGGVYQSPLFPDTPERHAETSLPFFDQLWHITTVDPKISYARAVSFSDLSFWASCLMAVMAGFGLYLVMRAYDAKLERERSHFDDIMDLSYDWIWEMDSDLRFTENTASLKEISHVDLRTIIGKTRNEAAVMFGNDISGPQWEAHFRTMEERKTFRDFTYPITNAHGVVNYVCLAGKPVFSVSGRFKGYRGTGRNFTAEYRQRDALALANQRLVEAIKSSTSAFALFDKNDFLILCNDPFLEFLPKEFSLPEEGTSRKEMVQLLGAGTLAKENVAQDYHPDLMNHFAADNPPSLKTEICLEDGRWFQLNESRSAEDGRILSIIDITDIKTKNLKVLDTFVNQQKLLMEAAFENLPTGIVVFDKDHRLSVCNNIFLDLFGFPESFRQERKHFEELAKYTIAKGYNADANDPEKFVNDLLEMAHRPGEGFMEGTINKDVFVEFRCNALPDGGLVFIVSDVSRRKKAQAQLRLTQLALDSARENIIIYDDKHRIVYANAEFEKTTGYPVQEVIGKSADFLRSGRHDPEFFEKIREDTLKWGSWSGEIWNRRRNGEFYAAWLSVSAIHNEKGEIQNFIAISYDITVRKEDEERIWRQANFDALTSLPNRVMFFDRLRQTIANAQRDRGKFALFFIDLDGFKDVNDTYGHAIGDQLLVGVSQRLQNTVRQSDIVARLSGDEFTVIVRDIASNRDIGDIALKILKSLDEPFALEDKITAKISASIGISLYPDDGISSEILLKKADDAMYQSKRAGKNQARFVSQQITGPFHPEPHDNDPLPRKSH